MSEPHAAQPTRWPRPRLNPFVFPSETTFRFALLVVAVLGANLYIWSWLWKVVGADQKAVLGEWATCATQNRERLASVRTVREFDAASDAFTACVQHASRPMVWWLLGGTALLVGVAAALLLTRPWWIARRGRLRPLAPEDAPAVVAELGALVREAGLREEPRWLWNPLDPVPTGLAFGRPGAHAVALTGGLLTRHVADPPAFRAVVRHELAHLRNRDVDVTYVTLSLWHAFLLAGVLPFAIVMLGEGTDTILRLGWRLLALALLVYLTRNAVLRAREVYADVRASIADGPAGGLRPLLASLPRLPVSPWGRLRSVHPSGEIRLESVEDTRRLFLLAPLVAFGTGVATTIAYETAVSVIALYVADPLTMRILAGAVFAPLAMGVVGVGIWRGAWGSLAEARPRPSTWPLALAFAAGVLVGPELALERGVLNEDTMLSSAFDGAAPWIAAQIAGIVLLLAWIGASAEEWLRAVAGSKKPARATVAGLVVASGVLALLVGTFYAARDQRAVTDAVRGSVEAEHALVSDATWAGPLWLWKLVMHPQVVNTATREIVFAAVVALWLFPVAAWLLRRREQDDTSWAFLDPGGRLALTPLGRVPRGHWRIGMVVGLGCLAAMALLRLALHSGVDAETRAGGWFVLGFLFWQLLLALLAQGIAGAWAAARADDVPPLVASLAAAFVTGVLATVGITVGPTVGSCIDPIALNPAPCAWMVDSGFTWEMLRQVVAQGALAALVGGALGLGAVALLHRRHESEIHPAGVPG